MKSDQQRVMDSIRRIVQMLRVASRRVESQFGLSGAQLFVMQKLAAAKATSLNELAERTLTHQSSVSVVVHKLVDRGLVTRSASSADARRIVLSLTARGRKLVENAPLAAQEQLIGAIHKLPPRDRKQLALLLEEVSSAADTAPPPLFFEEPHHNGKKKNERRRN